MIALCTRLQECVRSGSLTKYTSHDRFEDLLRAITIARPDICEAMVFALDNAESASEVAETMADALTLAETPVPTKVARLMLVSDVLHNSTAPVRNASRYRSLLEAHLPDVFESLQVPLLHSLDKCLESFHQVLDSPPVKPPSCFVSLFDEWHPEFGADEGCSVHKPGHTRAILLYLHSSLLLAYHSCHALWLVLPSLCMRCCMERRKLHCQCKTEGIMLAGSDVGAWRLYGCRRRTVRWRAGWRRSRCGGTFCAFCASGGPGSSSPMTSSTASRCISSVLNLSNPALHTSRAFTFVERCTALKHFTKPACEENQQCCLMSACSGRGFCVNALLPNPPSNFVRNARADVESGWV